MEKVTIAKKTGWSVGIPRLGMINERKFVIKQKTLMTVMTIIRDE